MCEVNRGRIITVVCLLLFCVIVFLPPIIYGYVYPNVGDDSAEHLLRLDRIKEGESPLGFGYFGYFFVGYPMVFISGFTGLTIDTIFLWFSYAMLVLVGVTLYFVVSRLVSKTAGWLALVLALFCSQGILFMFYYGQIFNVINIGIILPLLLFFVVKYLAEKKAYQLALAVIFAALFSTFHTTGIYLPFVAIMGMVVHVIHSRAKRQPIKLWIVWIGVGMIALSALCFWRFVPDIARIAGGITVWQRGAMAVPVVDYLLGIVSPTTLGVLIFLLVVIRRDMLQGLRREVKLFAVLLACLATILAVAAFAKLSVDPFRQALDLATILALLAAVFVGVFMKRNRKVSMALVLAVVVCFGLFHNIPTWFGYNSAVRPADREAIAYINTLDYGAYNCSAEIAPWIYDRFTKAKHTDGDGKLLIIRSLPMTPRSDVANYWYDERRHVVEPDDSFTLDKEFADDKVSIRIYRKN